MLNNILLNSGLNAVAFNTVAIFGIILALAFIFSLVVDLIFLIFAPKRNGLFFKRPKLKDKSEEVEKVQEPQVIERIVYKEATLPQESKKITPYENVPTVIPYSELDKTEELFTYNFNDENENSEATGVDFQKAIEEQKLIESKNPHLFSQNTVRDEVNVYSVEEDEDDSFEAMFRTIENEISAKKEEDIEQIIAEVQAQAMSELSDQGTERVRLIRKPRIEIEEIVKEVEEIEEETSKAVEIPTRKIARAKIIFRPATQVVEEKVKEEEPVVVEEVVEATDVKVEEDLGLSELRKIREDIFNLRVQAFNELKSAAIAHQPEEAEVQETVEIEESIDEETQKRLDELEAERQLLLKTNINVLEQNEDLEKEVEELSAKIETLKSQPVVEVAGKPVQSKEYYENRLVEIDEELKDVEKDLRKNKREFNPLKRIKRTFDRDVVKLRRKEATVAKQKLSIYGVNKTENIDDEKVKKLEEEVEILMKLKESVHQCEKVLKENKDRYPVLENSIKILTRHVESLNKEKEAITKELEWFENN